MYEDVEYYDNQSKLNRLKGRVKPKMKTRKVDVKIQNPDGTIVFQKDNFEIPEDWSDRAATIVASKYAMDNEFSAIDIINRVVYQITQWGLEQGYFPDENENSKIKDTAQVFQANLTNILINQRAAFNSPVWFNVGSDTGTNQASGCFILPSEDNMTHILEQNTVEGNIFKGGSGAGRNISAVRGKGEKLSNRGISSGPVSFMKMYDATAGIIRSGGKTRRSAKLVCMDVDHPDIEEFINCKSKEEEKAKILIEAGVSPEEAYATVAFQNTNHSIRVTDKFMISADCESEGLMNWNLVNRGDKEKTKISSKRILRQAAQRAWETGDPGIQYDTRMNEDNPVPSLGRINSTNPCLTADMELLTSKGYIPIGELVDDWEVKLINKDGEETNGKIWSNGKKDICEVKFHWKSGLESLKCTPDHKWMLIDGSECEAKDLRGKRLMPQETAFDMSAGLDLCKDAFLAGFVQGDGNPQRLKSDAHKKVEVYFGKDDGDVAAMFQQPTRVWYSEWAARVTKEFEILTVPLPERNLPFSIITGKVTKQKTDFLSGLFSANGCVIKDTRVALKTSCKNLAENLKAVLEHDYSIKSYITKNRAHDVVFKNGTYNCKESYDLNIYKYTDLIKFYHTFWFAQEYKREALIKAIIKRSPTVTAVKNAGNEEVFDFNEPSTHWGIVNGFICHNCSEFAAVNNSSCNLCSLNLVKYYEPKAPDTINWLKFSEDIKVLITAMDILVDAADYPTSEIREMTTKTRPLGLGFSNLGALLMLMGHPYDSDKGRKNAKYITREMTTYAYEQSIELAKRLGSFEAFEDNKETNIKLASRLTQNYVGEEIEKYGLRNSQVTLLAPTGTVSFVMDCDTTGIEPLFALKTIKTLAGGGTMEIEASCVTKACEIIKAETGVKAFDEQIIRGFSNQSWAEGLFKTANEIPWRAHIDMMAACQPHLNGAISKTVNLPSDATVQDIIEAYKYGWESGLKCIAVYRDGCKLLQPMTDANKKKEEPKPKPKVADSLVAGVAPAVRLKPALEGMGRRLKIDIGGHEGYVHAGMYPDGSLCEIFIRMSKEGSMVSGMMDAFATSVSLGLQHGVPLSKLVEKFKNTQFQPSGWTPHEDIGYASSIVDYIFTWLELRFLQEEIDEEEEEDKLIVENVEPKQALAYDGPECENCKNITSKVGTCYLCSVCGETSGCS